jgi:hypothetical protein
LPPAKDDYDYTLLPVTVKGKKEVFLPPSGCYRRTEAEQLVAIRGGIVKII